MELDAHHTHKNDVTKGISRHFGNDFQDNASLAPSAKRVCLPKCYYYYLIASSTFRKTHVVKFFHSRYEEVSFPLVFRKEVEVWFFLPSSLRLKWTVKLPDPKMYMPGFEKLFKCPYCFRRFEPLETQTFSDVFPNIWIFWVQKGCSVCISLALLWKEVIIPPSCASD